VSTLIFGAELGAWPRFSFIFRGIYDFKDTKAPVTAALNTFAAIVDFSRFNNSCLRLLKISDDNE
jgi:hypothetical protein